VRIRGEDVMRYINPRYLLTYLLTLLTNNMKIAGTESVQLMPGLVDG